MRIIFVKWGNFNEDVIEETLPTLGHWVRTLNLDPEDNGVRITSEISRLVTAFHCDAVFSVDYFQILAQAADRSGVLYYSWLFHEPQWSLFSNQAQLSCNRIYTFDSAHVEELHAHNIPNVHYLSLAADKKLLSGADSTLSDAELEKYTSDVSFVGTLYEAANNYFNTISDEAKESKTYQDLLNLIKQKMFTYGKNVLQKGITGEMVEFLALEAETHKNNYYFASREDIAVRSVLARKITVEERKTVVRALARKFDFKIYTNSNTDRFPEIRNMGSINFRERAPIVFNRSKINVYVTPRAIQSGIPLRVLEIMACNGFVLTNYQEELAKEFTEGRDIVMYRSLDDLIEKTEYYLTHEDERKAIADAAYEKVAREYNYASKLRQLFDKQSCGTMWM